MRASQHIFADHWPHGTVRQESFYLDEGQTNADIIAALREECLVKKDGDKTAKIGFAA